jgi:hypothetical protein
MGRNNQRKAKRVLLLVLAISALIVTFAQAELITIAIEAVVDTVEDEGNYLEGQISPGNIITGYYAYDSTTPDSNPSLNIGRYEYNSSPFGIFLTVGGFNFETDLENVDFILEITNDYPPNDDYLVRSHNNIPLSKGTQVDSISWWLNDDSGEALINTELPLAEPILSDWSLNSLTLISDRMFSVDAHVTLATPEPTAILLLGFGGLFLKRGRL